MAAFLAGRAAGRPVAVMVQSYADAGLEDYVRGWVNAATKAVYRRIDAAVCASEGLLPSVARLGVRSDRTWVIPNGIDVGRIRTLASPPPEGCRASRS